MYLKKKRTRIINDNKCCKLEIQNNRIYLNGAKIGRTFSNISSTVPTALICTNKLANLLFRQFISKTRRKWKAISSPRIERKKKTLTIKYTCLKQKDERGITEISYSAEKTSYKNMRNTKVSSDRIHSNLECVIYLVKFTPL